MRPFRTLSAGGCSDLNRKSPYHHVKSRSKLFTIDLLWSDVDHDRLVSGESKTRELTKGSMQIFSRVFDYLMNDRSITG